MLKCLGTPGRRALFWTDVEVRPANNGKPQVLLCGAAKEAAQNQRVSNILLSIAHCRAYATAYAIAVGNGPRPVT